MVAEFVAAAIVEWSYDPSIQIGVRIDGDNATIIDTGRGIQVAPDPGEAVGHAQKAFTTPYPLLAAEPALDEILDEVIRDGRPSVGVAAATAACPHLRLVSRRGHEAAVQTFEHGEPTGPAEALSVPFGRGTTIELRTTEAIDPDPLIDMIGSLRSRLAGLSIAGPDARVRDAARVLVTTPDDVLLFRGTDPARPDAGSWWFPPGGELIAGETAADAARRELREETGLAVSSVGAVIADRFAVFSYLGELLHSREWYFAITVDRFEISDTAWEDEERAAISGHRWWSRAELESTTDTVYPEALLELLDR